MRPISACVKLRLVRSRRQAWLSATAMGSALLGAAFNPAMATPITAQDLDFGTILVGKSAGSQTSLLMNSNSTNQTTNIAGATAPFTGASKSGVNIAKNGGHVATNAYNFAPGSAGSSGSQAFTQTIAVTDTTDAGNSTSFKLSGTAVAPIGAVSASDAGNVYIAQNHSGTAVVTITNTGHGGLAGGTDSSTNPKYLHITSVGGSIGAFAGSGTSTADTLMDGQSRSFNYAFAPGTRGAQSATITYNFSDGSADGKNSAVSSSIKINGVGVAPVASVAGSDSGYVLVGKTGSATVTVTNTGDGNKDKSLPASVTNLNGTAAALSSGEFIGAGGSFSIADQGSNGFNYVFAPTIRGAVTENVGVSLANGAGNGNASGTLNGSVRGQGVAPVQSVSATGAGNVRVEKVRIGTDGQATVTVQNVGDGNLSGLGNVSNLHGTVSGPTGGDAALFSGSGGVVDLADKGSASFSYSFAPMSHAQSGTSVIASFSNGNSDNTNAAQVVPVTISGRGVGPVYHSVGAPGSIVDFGLVKAGTLATRDLLISNISADPGDVTLTGLSLLSGDLSGAQAGNFSLQPGTIGEVLSEGSSTTLALDFQGLKHGTYLAGLTILTDQDSAFGYAGDSFSYELRARVVPEPSSLVLLGVAFGGVVSLRRRIR